MTVDLERPTPIETPEGQARFQALFRTLLTMKVPEGYRAEIIGGSIVMSPWSKGYYLAVMRSLRTQLEPRLRPGQLVESSRYLFTFPGQERAYGPDVFVASAKAFRTTSRYIDGEALTLVAELTSGSIRTVDWTDKLPVYGKAGVPVYLLLDMEDHTVSVFSTPTPLGYAERRTVGFGEEVPLPEPFGFALETIGFGYEPEDGERQGEK
ncbi:Uma2 family endonuclease [Streptomyces iconiensis]|uniref:Uma2 family endonuclease n=1 Tax=Streptomyces iconiensis TaxID=1384038 RepID=A0ABT6ZN45_9ACTN|nr:Uma2 family endonuclease [Streptomyces iconiensis]MDJ1130469.1 Uma2 family endonuclease [Streptomyces iconiensis]